MIFERAFQFVTCFIEMSKNGIKNCRQGIKKYMQKNSHKIKQAFCRNLRFKLRCRDLEHEEYLKSLQRLSSLLVSIAHLGMKLRCAKK